MKFYLGTGKYGDIYTILDSNKPDSNLYDSYSDYVIYGRPGSGKTAFIKNEIRYLEATNKPSDFRYVIITDNPEEMNQFNDSLYIYDKVININNKEELDALFDMLRREKCIREDELIRQNLQSLDQITSNVFPNLVVFIDNAAKLFKSGYLEDKHIFANSHAHIYNFISLDKPCELPPPYVHAFPMEIQFIGESNIHEYSLRYEDRDAETVKAVIRSKEEWAELLSDSATDKRGPIKLEISENQLEDLHKYLRNMPENKRILELFTMFEFYKKYSGCLGNKYDKTVKSLDAFKEEISHASKEQVLATKNKIVDAILDLFKDDAEIDGVKFGDGTIKLSSSDILNQIKYYCELVKVCDVKLGLDKE